MYCFNFLALVFVASAVLFTACPPPEPDVLSVTPEELMFAAGDAAPVTVTVTQEAGKPDDPDDPDNPDYNLDATPAQMNFSNTAGSKTLQITANVAWSIGSDQTWCTVSQASGEGNASVDITVAANTDAGSRTAKLNLTSSEHALRKTITVTQAGNPEPVVNIMYVSSELGNDSNDGLTWNTAMKTIGVALDAASAGWQVWVDNGTYQAQQPIILKDGVSVYGRFDRTEKSIAERKARTVIMRNPFDQETDFSTPTAIDGFKITALLTPSWYIRGNGTVNNCELSGSNVGDMIGYLSPCLYVNGGTVSNSLIIRYDFCWQQWKNIEL